MAEPPVEQAPNPYAPPRADPGADAADAEAAAGGITRQEMQAYVVKNGQYYWRAWSRMQERRRSYAGFNVVAFLFSVLWMGYRRLYVEIAVATAAVIASNVASSLLERYVLPTDMSRSVDLALSLAYGVAFGAVGNMLYLRRARLAIAAARADEPDSKARMALLARRGGTSGAGVLVGVAAIVAVTIASMVTVSLLDGPQRAELSGPMYRSR